MICNICHCPIDEKKEFAKFIHYNNSESILSECYYHVTCFREKMSRTPEILKLQRDAQRIMDFAKRSLGMDEEEILEVIN